MQCLMRLQMSGEGVPQGASWPVMMCVISLRSCMQRFRMLAGQL